MRRTRAYSILFVLILAFAGYAGWTLWTPQPTIKYHENVDAKSRVAAEEYLEQNQPAKTPLTLASIWNRAANPYAKKGKSIFVANIEQRDGTKFLYISCPQNGDDVNLAVNDDGTWRRADPSDSSPIIGRLFQQK